MTDRNLNNNIKLYAETLADSLEKDERYPIAIVKNSDQRIFEALSEALALKNSRITIIDGNDSKDILRMFKNSFRNRQVGDKPNFTLIVDIRENFKDSVIQEVERISEEETVFGCRVIIFGEKHLRELKRSREYLLKL